MPQNTNLNVTPYYDDFDKFKNFYKVLYRPGFPIQARELTTMQSILQNQIENMGNHFFKDGAMVIPGQVGFDNNVECILVQSSFLGSEVELYRSQLNNLIITGVTTGVKAKVLYSIPASESSKNFITLYIKYVEAGGDNKDVVKFQNNEQLLANDEITYGTNLIEIGSPFAQLIPNNATSTGSVAYINNGVYFIRGYFVDVSYQYIILQQYAQNPSFRVGLEISESIITPEDDTSLNDNAAGSSNYAAPGAHRLKIGAQLVKKSIGDDADKNFIELVRIKDGKIEKLVDRTMYSELEKTLARRTYDLHGNFMIRQFQISVRECLNNGSNNGVYQSGEYTQDRGVLASNDLYALEIGPGKVYLNGFPIRLTAPKYLDMDKSRAFKSLGNQIIPFELGNYIQCTNSYGVPVVSGPNVTASYQIIELKDEFNAIPGSSNGTTIGFARVAAWEFMNAGSNALEGNPSGEARDDIYTAHIFDISMLTMLKLQANATILAGSQIVGATSGAKGFIRISGGLTSITSDTLTLIQTTGNFVPGEIIRVDGKDKGTISNLYAYQISDVRSVVGSNTLGTTIFTSDLVLTETTAIAGNYFTFDGSTTPKTLTGYNSNIALDVRAGDKLYYDVDKYFLVEPVPADFDLNTDVFVYADQVIKITDAYNDAGVVQTLTNGQQFNTLIRLRPQIEEQQFGDLFIEFPKEAIKSITDESVIVRRTLETQTTSDSFTFSLPETQQFAAVEFENYTLMVTGSSGSYDVGDIIPLQTSQSGSVGYTTFNTSGVPRTTITVSNLTGISSVRLIATISKNTITAKVKNPNKMSVWKVNRTTNSSDQIPYGLAYSPIFATRIEDEIISLGVTDAYKLHAVYESYNDDEAIIPNVTLVEPAFFAPGSIITGKKSTAKALVVDFNSSTLKLSLVYQTSVQLQQNETIDGFNSLGEKIQGLVSDASGSVNSGSKNITDNYTLKSGQKDFYYGISYLERKKGTTVPIRKIKIVADYFTHETTGDYFNVNSYVGTAYEDIPVYISSPDKLVRTKPLADVADFRPAASALTATGATGSVTNPYYLECSTLDFPSRLFDADATKFDIPKKDSDFRSDYEFYLKRIDKVFVNEKGKFFVIQGTSAENPIPGDNIDKAMLLATIGHNAYGFDPNIDARIFAEDIRRYTMRDIARLDKRVKNIEYYSALTLLEQETESLMITDEFGLNKFKNGFMVDSFDNFSAAERTHPDYNAAMDFNERTLRPKHYTTQVSLQVNESASSNYVRNTGIVTLPFTSSILIEQPYASQVENVNPFNVFTFIGHIDLNPSSDNWVETNRLPREVIQTEGDYAQVAQEIGADQNGYGPEQWGSWVDDVTGAFETVSGGEWQGWVGPLGRRIPAFGTRTTTLNGVIERRTGTQQRLVASFEEQSLGDRTLSKQNISNIRSRNIAISAERLKPLTRFFGFFDNQAITNYITPKLLEIIKNPDEDSRTNNIPFQIDEDIEVIITQTAAAEDGVGSIETEQLIMRAKVKAPNHEIVYNPYTDTELPEVYSANTAYLNLDVNMLAQEVDGDYYGYITTGAIIRGVTSEAQAVIRDRRLLTDRRGSFRGAFFIPDPSNDANPRWETGERLLKLTVSETNETALPGSTNASNAQVAFEASGTLETVQETVLNVRNAEIVTETLTDERAAPPRVINTEQVEIGWWDPLAQSFLIQEEGGCYLSKIDIFFASKDPNIPINLQIREMENGYPTQKILPFSTVTIYPENVELSENASLSTTFNFKIPIYISPSVEYCFVLFTDSNEYTVWISEMGQIDITGNRTISEQPYAGVLFKSQNASTWTANQLQDLKFNLYKAIFSPTSGKLVLNNNALAVGNKGILNLRNNPIKTQEPNQVLILNDQTASFTVGARIYQETTNASATITEFDTTANPYRLTVTQIDGSFLQGSDSGGNVVYPLISSQSTGTLQVSNTTVDYTTGKLITGQTSGATAYITGFTDNGGNTATLTVNYLSEAFTDGETIRQSNPQIDSTLDASGGAYAGDTTQKFVSVSPVYADTTKTVTVLHSNHGMHDLNNNVVISGVQSEVSPILLRTAITASDTTISVSDASAFHKKIGGFSISNDNPGYLKIGNEIIAYTAISNDGFTITVKTTGGRGAGETTAAAHAEGSTVYCYNLDGIPLTEINKTHTAIKNPTLDSYELATTSVSTVGIQAGGASVFASQNIAYETITPHITTLVQPNTEIITRFNGVSGTSIDDGSPTEASFVNDQSFAGVTLSSPNALDSQKLILSAQNEVAKLSGQKSLTVEMLLSTSNPNLTPVIDLDRCAVITTTNRINNPTNWEDSILAIGDPHEAVYITKMISLADKQSKSLKVMFDAYRPTGSMIRVLYKVIEPGFTGDEDQVLWRFFNTTGGPDTAVNPSNEVEFKSYEFNATGLEFVKFQIKVVMASPDQAVVPRIKYFRAIATAS